MVGTTLWYTSESAITGSAGTTAGTSTCESNAGSTCVAPRATRPTNEPTTPTTRTELAFSTRTGEPKKRAPPRSAAKSGMFTAAGSGASISAVRVSSSERSVPPCSMYATSSV